MRLPRTARATGERGVERAAFVVQQVLTAEGGDLTDTWAERHAAFEVITGGRVPRADRWRPPALARSAARTDAHRETVFVTAP